jgi:hypothetical protein
MRKWFRTAFMYLIALSGAEAVHAQSTSEAPSVHKKFVLSREQIRPLVEDHSASIASDRIMVDGARVGFMYREASDRPEDSGWRFLAGDEDDAYMDNAANHGVYAVNTVANYDPEIIPFLEAPVGSAFIRLGGKLVRDPHGAPQPRP